MAPPSPTEETSTETSGFEVKLGQTTTTRLSEFQGSHLGESFQFQFPFRGKFGLLFFNFYRRNHFHLFIASHLFEKSHSEEWIQFHFRGP